MISARRWQSRAGSGTVVASLGAGPDVSFGAFTDATTEFLELFGADDRVVLWWRTAAVHTGPYGDIPRADR